MLLDVAPRRRQQRGFKRADRVWMPEERPAVECIGGGPCGSFASRSAASDVLFWQPLGVPNFTLDLNPSFKLTPGLDSPRVTAASLGNNVTPSASDVFVNGNSSLQPTYLPTGWGGAYNLPALSFNGVSYYLVCTSGLAQLLAGGIDTAFTLFLVGQNRTLSGVRCLLGFFSTGSVQPVMDLFTSAGAYASVRRDNSGGVPAVQPTGGTPDTLKNIWTIIFTGTTLTVKINGGTIINAAPQDVVGAITFSAMILGATYGGASPNNWADLLFARLLGFTGVVSASDENYIQTNLTGIYS
jgi:hypothetical protein